MKNVPVEIEIWNVFLGKLTILLGTRSVHSAASHMKNVTCHKVEATGPN
jgi:hypothetical protein